MMKIMMPVSAILWIMLLSVPLLNAEVIVETNDGEEKAMSRNHGQKNPRPGKAPMRIEEPDGTLRPLPSGSIPESRMSTEGLRDVPDAGGGTMVNVEGRFQSILKVPDGSDHAIHHHESEDLEALKP